MPAPQSSSPTPSAPSAHDADAARLAAAREHLSSLVDGEAEPAATEQSCRQWRGDVQVRRDWHAYQLIGDVLRSDELARPAARDAAFLARLRERLADEPVPLAPAPVLQPPARAQRRWMAPAAAVAGFVAVGVAVVVLREGGPGSAGMAGAPTGWNTPVSATAPAEFGLTRRVGGAAAPSASQATLDGQLIRDARLDAYFEAHRGAVGAMPSAVPGGGALRSVEILVPQR